MPAGRPTLYRAEYADQIRKLCLLGATNDEMALFFNVSPSTFEKWIKKHEEVRSAMLAGKALANSQVADRLYQRAMGYSHPDIDVRVIHGVVVKTPIIKHYPPDTVACIFWLKNRDKANWRDRQEVDHSGHLNYTHMTVEELDREIRKLEESTKGE